MELVAQLGLNALWHGTLNVTEVLKDVASPWRVHDVREKTEDGMMIGSGDAHITIIPQNSLVRRVAKGSEDSSEAVGAA